MKFKETALGIIALGALGSITGNLIQRYATLESDYNGLTRLLNSNITIPSWSLFLIIMLVFLMIYIIILKERDVQRTIKEKDQELENEIKVLKRQLESPEQEKKVIEEKQEKYKLAKLLANYLHESCPKTSEELCSLVENTSTYDVNFIVETISDLVHHKIFESYPLGNGFQLTYDHQRVLERNFKP
ncbi:hypothetical protein [Halarcobacter ebronensis]|uniref:hypothetical protein n=1 Tax=Halarcobacter ebronensis TaxID=1462615 RepID=UPI003C741627